MLGILKKLVAIRTAARCRPSLRDLTLGNVPDPNVDTLGYFRKSLRDSQNRIASRLSLPGGVPLLEGHPFDDRRRRGSSGRGFVADADVGGGHVADQVLEFVQF
jgi:hypothetical protein